MIDPPGPHDDWNEFRWEHEIRRDERRISCYYRELPGCLDLPGEEDMIFNSLLSRPDLVPTGASPDSLRTWRPPEDEEDDEESEGQRPPRPADEVVEQLDRLASEWNALAASRLRSNLELPGLGISCAYGKLLARAADFVDTDENRERALKISLGKRALADLNELTGELYRIISEQRSLRVPIGLQIELLGHIRERLIDQLERVRALGN